MDRYVLFDYQDGVEEKTVISQQKNVDVLCKKLSVWKLKATDTETLSWKERLVRLELVLSTHGTTYVYYVMNEKNEVIHTSLLVGGCGKFPFVKANEFEIGPCKTSPSERGRGIYPYVLEHIISDRSDAKRIYIFAEEANVASIRGIEKTRFKRCGYVKRISGIRRRYVKDEG